MLCSMEPINSLKVLPLLLITLQHFPSCLCTSVEILSTHIITPSSAFEKRLQLSSKSVNSLIQNTINVAQNARSTIIMFQSAVDHTSSNASSSAVNQCLYLLDDSIDHLNSITQIQPQSIDNSGSSSCNRNRNTNVCSSLSAILANQEICMEGLDHHYVNFIVKGYYNNNATLRSAIEQLNPLLSQIVSAVLAANGNLSTQPQLKHNQDPSPLLSGKSSKSNIMSEQISVANNKVTVALDGSGNYRSIQAAIDAAPSKSNQKFIIYVKRGVYNEYVEITKSKQNLVMIGDGIDATVVTGSRSTACDGLQTIDTATFVVSGCGFMAQGITFENTAGPLGEQAVALLAKANNLVFYRCAFKGYQDTLYAKSGIQFFRECKIYGTMDFIFGDAAAVFQKCEIIVRKTMPKQDMIIVTAQGRKLECSATGFSFHQCNITADHDFTFTSLTKTYLGRPWRPYSRVVVMKCHLGSLIDPLGWRPWNSSDNRSLNTLYYGEYMNDGAGSDVKGRVKWPGFHPYMSFSEANMFTVRNFILGNEWLPSTSVTFDLDL